MTAMAAPVNTPADTPVLGGLRRRALLGGLLAGSSVWAARGAWAQSKNGADADGRLVVLFLRGAYDGLSAFVPYADPDYYALRPRIAIAAPDGSAQTTIALDGQFGLHPALASLHAVWQQGALAVVPAAGLSDPTRSHFDAQHQWELGIPGKTSGSQGWLNRLAALPPSTARGLGRATAMGVGEANPFVLSGAAPTRLVPRGGSAAKPGVLADEGTRYALLAMYAGLDDMSRTFRAGIDSRMQTAQGLSEETPDLSSMASDRQEMAAANNGAPPAQGLLLDAQYLGKLMRQDRSLRLGFLSVGNWDTHANQGAATGQLANSLGNLARTLLQLRKDFDQPNDVVLICSEFGRTCAENGTRGTDHGHGNAMWLMGKRVQGGRWHGQWSGLAPGNLHEGRDLPVHHDYRAVVAQVLRRTQGLSGKDLDALFPGMAWDAALDAMMRS